MSISQDHTIIQVEDEDTMDTENEEETQDPEEETQDPEEDFMTKLQNHIPDLRALLASNFPQTII